MTVPPLTPLEIATGLPLEITRPAYRPATQTLRRARLSSRIVLEGMVLEHLRRGPLSVSFSGGRDSSLVLAVATHVARREGHPDPLPITMRHDSPSSREDEHQEAVVRHLGLHHWLKVDIGESLRIFGEVATDFYLKEGIRVPANAYFHLAMTAVAPKGTLLTGGGGDEMFGTQGWRLAQVLAGRRRVGLRDVALVGLASAPTPLRRRLMARKHALQLPWLRPAAMARVRRLVAGADIWSRVRWDVEAMYYARSRATTMLNETLDRVGSTHGMRIASPFTDERFVAAFAAEAGRAGPPSREAAMRMLGQDVLPEVTLGRRDKADFNGMVWGGDFRRFVDGWRPETLTPGVAELVDPGALRHAWREPFPHYQTMLLAQQAWLDQRAARAT